MAVKIRLKRMGRRNQSFYRVVAVDGRSSTRSSFLENLGWYDPQKAHGNYELKLDRIDHWVDNGAILSDTAKSLVRQAKAAAPVVTEEPPAEEEAAPAEEASEAAEEAGADAEEETKAEAEPEEAGAEDEKASSEES
ncbi:MAG: 30S ribosomal protein S16 [Verrucomicrobiota bacterium]